MTKAIKHSLQWLVWYIFWSRLLCAVEDCKIIRQCYANAKSLLPIISKTLLTIFFKLQLFWFVTCKISWSYQKALQYFSNNCWTKSEIGTNFPTVTANEALICGCKLHGLAAAANCTVWLRLQTWWLWLLSWRQSTSWDIQENPSVRTGSATRRPILTHKGGILKRHWLIPVCPC